IAHVQATGGKPVPLKILRGGKPMTLQITPEPGKESAASTLTHDVETLWTWSRPSNRVAFYLAKPNGGWIADLASENQFEAGPTAGADRIEKRLDALDRELKQLR